MPLHLIDQVSPSSFPTTLSKLEGSKIVQQPIHAQPRHKNPNDHECWQR